MSPREVNPYQSSRVTDGSTVRAGPAARSWLMMIAMDAGVYYSISALTLPFAGTLWFGEAPLLALVQVPKAFVKQIFQSLLLNALPTLGLSQDSPSLDYIATHGPAMVLTVTVPPLLLLALIGAVVRDRLQIKLIAAVVVCASVDAIVTIWFDAGFSLRLFNRSFF